MHSHIAMVGIDAGARPTHCGSKGVTSRPQERVPSRVAIPTMSKAVLASSVRTQVTSKSQADGATSSSNSMGVGRIKHGPCVAARCGTDLGSTTGTSPSLIWSIGSSTASVSVEDVRASLI